MNHRDESSLLPWAIVGFGRVGQTLGLVADRLQRHLAWTWNRSQASLEEASVTSPAPRVGPLPDALADDTARPLLIWLCVVDDAIVDTFNALSPQLAPGSVVVHTSGNLASTALEAPDGLHVASLHPLLAIADPHQAIDDLADAFWTVEGDPVAIHQLQLALQGSAIDPAPIESHQKTLYHASAVTAANLLISLFDAATTMAQCAGLDPDQAQEVLLNLSQSSLKNLEDSPPSQALTGPAARGDQGVIDQHLRALADLDDPQLQAIYHLLTQRALAGLR